MPLLDHFHPPLSERRHWEAFHARWASAIADGLNEQGLPENLFAEPTVHIGGQVQVDVATFEEVSESSAIGANPNSTAIVENNGPGLGDSGHLRGFLRGTRNQYRRRPQVGRRH